MTVLIIHFSQYSGYEENDDEEDDEEDDDEKEQDHEEGRPVLWVHGQEVHAQVNHDADEDCHGHLGTTGRHAGGRHDDDDGWRRW